jgi:hypothetical protein
MKTSAKDEDECLTASIPYAGKKAYGLSRSGSYAAAERGDIPTIEVGPKLKRVPMSWLRRLRDGEEHR